MLEFKPITDFPRGTLYRQLLDAYSFDARCQAHWQDMWQSYDDFYFDNPHIAAAYGFVTVLDGEPVGHITWDPRNRPDHVAIGHNCILTASKGRGLGKLQLLEALRGIKAYGVSRIIVTTNVLTLPAQKNYESVGFVKLRERPNPDTPFAGNYIDYEMRLPHISQA